MNALDKRDSAFENRNKAVIDAIVNLNNAFCAQLKEVERGADEHDRYVRESFVKIGNISKDLSDHYTKVDNLFKEAVTQINGKAARKGA